jgi:hypothetical protein
MSRSVLRRARVSYAVLFATTRNARKPKAANQNKKHSHDFGLSWVDFSLVLFAIGFISSSSFARLKNQRPTEAFSRPKSFAFETWPHRVLCALLRRPFVEDGAHSLLIESQTESIFLRKLGYLFFSILLVYRPNLLQVLLVNPAVLPYAMHPSLDFLR